MRLMIATALAALPIATGAQAAEVYSACYFSKHVTQLFVLKGDALKDSYGGYTYEDNREWEAKFAAKEPARVRDISGYGEKSFMGQFADYAKANNNNRGSCWVTTSRDRALAWFRKYSRENGYETALLRDWRPVKAGVLAVEDWSGYPSSRPMTVSEPETKAATPSTERSETAAPAAPVAPVRPKKSNAQADAEYAAAMAVYERQMATHRQQVDDYERAQVELARKKDEQRVAVEAALAAHRREMEKAEAAQLEYRKELARPPGLPHAIFRGFTGKDCDDARRSAVRGAGTTAGTQFREVRTEMSESGTCLVQGWWWNTGEGGVSRQ